MMTITLEVSDQLAAEIESIRDELPVLLAITRQLFRPASEVQVHTSPVYLAYKRLLDFLASEPTHEHISRFTISPQAQARVHELLDKHGEGELNEEEQAELRVYAQINEVMGLKKAQILHAHEQPTQNHNLPKLQQQPNSTSTARLDRSISLAAVHRARLGIL
jgi:hypothetical protein